MLAGILILVIELRQNSAALRSNVLQAVSSEANSLNLAIASDATIRATWIQGLRAPESLTDSQELQFNVTLHVWFSNAQNWYYQMQDGVLDDEIADGHWTTMATMRHVFPGFRNYWETRAYSYTPAFRDFVEADVFTREPLDYSPDPYGGHLVSESETQAIASQLDKIYDLSKAEGSVEAMTENHLRFFVDQPTVLPPNQEAIVGREAVAEFYSSAYRNIKFVDNSYTDLTIVIQGDTATRQYVGTGVFEIAGLEEPQTVSNRYVDVMTRKDGEWKTLLHSWASANLQ